MTQATSKGYSTMRYPSLAFALALLLASAFPALTQNQSNPTIVGNTGAYNASPPTCTDGNWCAIQTDVNGKLLTTSTSTVTGAVTVTGNVASGATDSGNPVKVGGVYNSTFPTLTTGQRGDIQLGSNGELRVLNGLYQATGADAFTNGNLGFATPKTTNTGGNLLQTVGPYKFNGSTWDRDFTCPSTAVINVTAAATTELVALTAAQTIRVCSFVITESLAGTAQFVYGTGSNCGTGTTNITGAMALATSGVLAISSGNGSVFRTASANALCLAAVTGNITGFVTYAKY